MEKKRLLSFIIIVFAMFLLTNCSNADETNNPSVTTSGDITEEIVPEETTSEFDEDDLGEFDFNGYTFSIWSRVTNYFHGYIDVVEEVGDVLDDEIYKRNRRVEERFNFTITELTGSDDAGAKNTVLAGDNTYDMINTRVPNGFAWAQEGIIHSMSVLPHVDFDKKYWHHDLNSELTVANKMYFASGAFNVTAYDYTEALLVNKNLAEDLGIGNLYTLVNDGEWTLEKFDDYCRLARMDLDGQENISLEDQHGFLSTATMVMPSFWISCGVKTVYKDSNDIPYFAAMEPKFADAFDKIIAHVRNSDAWFKAPNPHVQNDPVLVNIFKSGRALFFDNQFYTIKDLRDMEIDFGILPFPKLNEDQDQYHTRLHWTEVVCLPISQDETGLERTSVILEALACESAKYVVPAYYEIALKTKMSRDEESEAMIDLLFTTRVFDYGDTIWHDVIRSAFTTLFETGSTNLISSMEKIQNNIQDKTVKLVTAFEALP